MPQTPVKLAEWELIEILDALRLASEDGQFEDEPGRAANVERLKSKLRRALGRAKP